MSALTFHTPSGDAELRGSEYAWMQHVAAGPARSAWNLDSPEAFELACEIITMIPEVTDRLGANHLHAGMRRALAQAALTREIFLAWPAGAPMPATVDNAAAHGAVAALQTALRVEGVALDVAGHRLHTRDLDGNTALVAGSDPIRVAAKLGRWGECHTWVDGCDRAWLADIFEQGLRSGIYRRSLRHARRAIAVPDTWFDQGWEQVLALLRARDDEPAVTSYSVCGPFPNMDVARWPGPSDPGWSGPDWVPDWWYDNQGRAEWGGYSHAEQESARRDFALNQWYELPAGRRWELAMAGLRQDRPWVRLAPDTLAPVMFGPELTVFDLFDTDRDDRIRAAMSAWQQTLDEQTRPSPDTGGAAPSVTACIPTAAAGGCVSDEETRRA